MSRTEHSNNTRFNVAENVRVDGNVIKYGYKEFGGSNESRLCRSAVNRKIRRVGNKAAIEDGLLQHDEDMNMLEEQRKEDEALFLEEQADYDYWMLQDLRREWARDSHAPENASYEDDDFGM